MGRPLSHQSVEDAIHRHGDGVPGSALSSLSSSLSSAPFVLASQVTSVNQARDAEDSCLVQMITPTSLSFLVASLSNVPIVFAAHSIIRYRQRILAGKLLNCVHPHLVELRGVLSQCAGWKQRHQLDSTAHVSTPV